MLHYRWNMRVWRITSIFNRDIDQRYRSYSTRCDLHRFCSRLKASRYLCANHTSWNITFIFHVHDFYHTCNKPCRQLCRKKTHGTLTNSVIDMDRCAMKICIQYEDCSESTGYCLFKNIKTSISRTE